MMSIKKRIGVSALGLVALGGSVFAVALSSGIASASGNTTTTASVVSVPGETNALGDSGANVQSGGQTGSQSTLPDATEVTSSETSSAVTSDGVGGVQDLAGSNVDSQTTGAQ